MVQIKGLVLRSALVVVASLALAGPSLDATAGEHGHFKGKSISVTVSVVPTADGVEVHDINNGRDNLGGRYMTDSVYVVSPFGIATGSGVTIYTRNANDRTFFDFELDLTQIPTTGVWIVTGGSGQNANATGSGTLTAYDNGNGTFTLVSEGTLTR